MHEFPVVNLLDFAPHDHVFAADRLVPKLGLVLVRPALGFWADVKFLLWYTA